MFNREVTCFRSTNRTWAMFLFLANKAISLMFYVMGLIQFASFPSDKVRTLFLDMSSDLTDMQIGCRGLHNAGSDINDCVFTLSLHSCSVFQNITVAVTVLQMVPWAGTVPSQIILHCLTSMNGLLCSPCICIKWWGENPWSPCICPISGTRRC